MACRAYVALFIAYEQPIAPSAIQAKASVFIKKVKGQWYLPKCQEQWIFSKR